MAEMPMTSAKLADAAWALIAPMLPAARPARLTTHNQHSHCVERNVFIYYEQVANGVCFPESFQCGAPSITTSGCQIPN
jgi:hypothetical protein